MFPRHSRCVCNDGHDYVLRLCCNNDRILFRDDSNDARHLMFRKISLTIFSTIFEKALS